MVNTLVEQNIKTANREPLSLLEESALYKKGEQLLQDYTSRGSKPEDVAPIKEVLNEMLNAIRDTGTDGLHPNQELRQYLLPITEQLETVVNR